MAAPAVADRRAQEAAYESVQEAQRALDEANKKLKDIAMARGGETEALMREAFEKYGPPHRIDFFGNQWRVWWTTWHEHTKSNPCASMGDLAIYGDTLVEALESVLARDKDHHVVQGHCCVGCPGYSSDID